LGASTFGGGGGGGAAVGTDPMIPPITPPATPPGTPPGTPPTTPCTPVAAGNSSSLIMVISLGMAFGCISLPASNWRGITFTILGAAAAGGGGGGGGGRRRHREAGQLRLRKGISEQRWKDDGGWDADHRNREGYNKGQRLPGFTS